MVYAYQFFLSLFISFWPYNISFSTFSQGLHPRLVTEGFELAKEKALKVK